MNVATIDNSSDTELERCITWQFDNAAHLIGIIQSLKDFFTQSTKNLWDGIIANVEDLNSNNVSSDGLTVWGKILGIDRPYITISGTTKPLSDQTYKKVLVGRFALLNGNSALGIVGNASVSDYVRYVNYVFGGGVTVSDGLDMSLTFSQSGLSGELLALFDQCKEVIVPYPSGVHDNALSGSLRLGLDPDNRTVVGTRQYGGLNNSSFTWN